MYIVIAVIALFCGFAIGVALYFKNRADTRKEREELRIRLARIEVEKAAGEEKLRWAEAAEEKLSHVFKSLASDALKSNSEQLTSRARRELETLMKPVNESLSSLDKCVRELESKREGAYASLGKELETLRTMHTSLKDTTTTLAQALKSPTVRGRWGEVQLRRVVEMAGLANHVDFDEQQTGDAGRPDMVVHLPRDGGELPIDSKVPLDSYLDAMESEDDQQRAALFVQHARALKNRVRELSQKAYWDQFERSPGFVVMFVPVEASLNAAFEHDADLFDYAMKNKVLICSPVNLLALLKVVAYGWQQQKIAENAANIEKEARELYKRIATFVGKFTDVGRNLDRAVRSYNEAVGSLDTRLIPSARRFKEMGLGTEEIGTPGQLETQPRTPSLAEGGEPPDEAGGGAG